MSVKKSLAWMGIGQLMSTAIQFVSSVVLARYLAPSEMGLVAVGFAVVAILSIFQQLGLNQLIIREPVLTDDLCRSAFTVNAIVTACLSLTIVLVSYAGAALVNDNRVRHVILILAICPLFGIFSLLPASNLERTGRFKMLAAISLVASTMGTLTTVALVLTGQSYLSLAYGHVVLSAAYALMTIYFGREHFSLRTGLASWRRTTEFGVLSMAVTGILNITQRLSEVGLGRFLGLAAVGFYSRANSMNLLIWGSVHSIISRVLLVDFANVHRGDQSLRNRYLATVEIVTAVLWPAFAGLAVISQSFIPIVYGERWISAATPLVFLSIASMIQVSVTMTPELFAIKDRLRTQTRIEAIRSVIGLLLFLGGCLVSLEAAAATRIVEISLAWLLYRPHINAMTDTNFGDLKWPYLKNLFLTAIAVGPSAVMTGLSGKGRLDAIELGFSIALGILLWIAALIATRHPLGNEAQKLWMKRRPAAS